MSTLFEAELREQPAALDRLLQAGRGEADAIAAAVGRSDPRFAVLVARGSSDNAARYGQYLFGIQNRLVAALATPSVFTHYHAPPVLKDALVVAVSQSGQSPDVVAVVEEARRQGAVTLAVVNDPASPLASAAELVFPLLAGSEHSVAATKTYTAQLTALAMLSAALSREERLWNELQRIPELVARTIEMNASRTGLAERFSRTTRMVVAGRGYNFATALEITLKIKETTGILADGYSSADFFHGPRAILDESLPVLLVAPGPRVFEELDQIARLALEKGAPLIAITDRAALLDQSQVALPLPDAIPEWISPIVAVVPGQLWALGLSLARGLNPDSPPGLSKVTETR